MLRVTGIPVLVREALVPLWACPKKSVQRPASTGSTTRIIVSASLRLNRLTIALWVYPRRQETDFQPLVVKEDSSSEVKTQT
jgi:hypothetical protein